MRRFKDALDREWTLAITMHTAILLRNEADFEIKDVLDPRSNLLARLGSDTEFLGQVLWTLVSEEAKSKQIDDRGFFSALGGDILDAAIDTLVAECFDFFPQAKRAPLQKAWKKVKGVDLQLSEQASQKLDEMTTEELMQMLRNQQLTGSDSDSRSLESSESIPGS